MSDADPDESYEATHRWDVMLRGRALTAETEVARLRAGIDGAIDVLTRMRVTSRAIGHGSCGEAQQEAIEHLRALLAGREVDR